MRLAKTPILFYMESTIDPRHEPDKPESVSNRQSGFLTPDPDEHSNTKCQSHHVGREHC